MGQYKYFNQLLMVLMGHSIEGNTVLADIQNWTHIPMGIQL